MEQPIGMLEPERVEAPPARPTTRPIRPTTTANSVKGGPPVARRSGVVMEDVTYDDKAEQFERLWVGMTP